MATTQVSYVRGTAEMSHTESPRQYEAERSFYMDGKCSCCPYGYHIDLDFVNYCESMANGGTLKNLRRIQRTKRKLRKSMEFMLQNQDASFSEGSSPVPPDVVHSTEASRLMHMVEYEQSATHHVLQQIDTTVGSRIDKMISISGRRHMGSEGDETDSRMKTTYYNTFPHAQVSSNGESFESSLLATSLSTSGRTDSLNSLSSVSTVSNEVQGLTTTQHTMHVTGMLANPDVTEVYAPKYQTVTSAQLAATVETHIPTEVTTTTTTMTTDSESILISRSSLQAIREAVAESLRRMKELEEQVKAIPILQVRISVLKEEKRMLMLQAKANASKKNSFNTRTIGVGETKMDFATSSPRGFDYQFSPRSTSPISTNIRAPTKVLTRSIGIGEDNVFDNSGVQIHEKELRTVIIGSSSSVGKRNVGIECRVPTRDVGVMYAFDDEKPRTRTVGINVDTGSLHTSVSFKSEELSTALRNVLHHSLRSVGTNCNMKAEMINVGTSVDRGRAISVGCGDDQIDVDVRSIKVKKSIGTMAHPEISNRAMNTDRGWMLDSSTNTIAVEKRVKATATDHIRQCYNSTNTDTVVQKHAKHQTDVKVFLATDQLKHVGCNSNRILTHSVGVNTQPKALTEENFNMEFSVYNKRDVDTNIQKEYDDEEQREDYSETITKLHQYEPVSDSSSSSRSSRTVTREIISDEPASYTTKTTKRITSSIPVTTRLSSSNSSHSVISDSTSGYTGRLSSDETDSSYSTENVSTIIQQEPVTSGYSITSYHSHIEPVEVNRVTTVSQSKEAIETNPNPFDYGSNFGGLRFKTRRTLVDNVDTSPKISSPTSIITRTAISSDIKHPPLEDPSEAEVENAEGYMRYIEGNNDGSEVKTTTTTIITMDSGNSDSDETVSSAKTNFSSRSDSSGSNAGGGGISYSSQSKQTHSAEHVDMNKFLNMGMESGVMETSADSGFGSGYTVTRTVKTMKSSGLDQAGGNVNNVNFTQDRVSSSDFDADFERQSRTSESGGGLPSFYSLYTSTFSPSGDNFSGTQYDSASSHDSKFDSLKSCIKKKKSESKRGITFADSVVGGTEHSTDDSDDDSESESYDEGSYDGRQGKIVYTCQDDEVISSKSSTQLFDQNIRETYELTDEMNMSCDVLANYLEDSTTIQTKQLNSSRTVIQTEWFKVTNNKLANVYEIEDYMSSFNEISKPLLKYVINMTDDNGNTALHYAVSHCNFEVVSLLLDTESCDIDKPNKAGYTAVMLAALASEQTSSQRAVVQHLFSQGDINAKSYQAGQTALMLAVSHGRTNMVHLLLEAGADVNQRDDDGSTALMCACEHGHTEIVKLLLGQPECNASLKDNDGSTALEIAMEAGHKDIGVILYAHLNFSKQLSPTSPKRFQQSFSHVSHRGFSSDDVM